MHQASFKNAGGNNMNMEIVIQNHTTKEVMTYTEIEEAMLALEDLREAQPTHEIEITQITTPIMDIPVTEDNLEALMACEDENELELILHLWKSVLGDYYTDSLERVDREREGFDIQVEYGSDLMVAFETYVRQSFEEFGDLRHFPEDLMDFFDYERYLKELKTRGTFIFELSYGFAFVRPKY